MPESIERGALTEAVYYILLSLHQPMHGYAMMQSIEHLTAGRVILGSGTLYGALNALVQKQWITSLSSEKDSRQKKYIITETGKAVFLNELERLGELLFHGLTLFEELSDDDPPGYKRTGYLRMIGNKPTP